MVDRTEYVANTARHVVHRVLHEAGATLWDARCNLALLADAHKMSVDAYHDEGVPSAVISLLAHGYRRCGRCWREGEAP